MSDIAQQCAKALADVLAFYKKKACPCAFPRFAQLAGFDFRHYNVGPVGCHLTDILIHLTVTGKEAILKPMKKWEGNQRPFKCSVCGSEGTLNSEQFNINMTLENFVLEKVQAQPLGAPAEDRIPIPNGFYGFKSADIAACRVFFSEATVQEMTDYLQALA